MERKKRLTNWRKIQWQGVKARSQESVGTHYANEMAAAWGSNLWGQSESGAERRNLSWEGGDRRRASLASKLASKSLGLSGFGKLSSTLHLFTIFLFVFSVGLSLGIILLLLN